MLLRVSVNFGPNAPLRFRRWLRVKVSGQGPSPAAEAQRSGRQTLSLIAAGVKVSEQGHAGFS